MSNGQQSAVIDIGGGGGGFYPSLPNFN